MKNMIVSHYDLDGISSVINVYNTIKNKDNFQYVLCGYDSLTKTINKLKREEFDILFNECVVKLIFDSPSKI